MSVSLTLADAPVPALCAALPAQPDALAAMLYLLAVRADVDADCRLYVYPGGALGMDGDQGICCGRPERLGGVLPLGAVVRREAAWLGLRTLLHPCGWLPEPGTEKLLIMRRPPEVSTGDIRGARSPADGEASPRPAEDTAEAVRILAAVSPGGMEKDAQERAYWYLSLFRRRGLGGAFTMDGASACLLRTPYGLLLENVATRPELRGQGRASRLLGAILPAPTSLSEAGMCSPHTDTRGVFPAVCAVRDAAGQPLSPSPQAAGQGEIPVGRRSPEGDAATAGDLSDESAALPVFLLCDPALEGFYAKHGFRRDGYVRKRWL